MLRLWYKTKQNKILEENKLKQELKKITEEFGTVKIIKTKEVQTGQKKQAMVCFSKEREAQETIT